MRAYLFMLSAAAAFALSNSASSQPTPRDEPSARVAPKEGYYGSVRCQELRKACLNKDDLSERAGGNCKWYRDNCR
jgi:uncharacterized membrane protein